MRPDRARAMSAELARRFPTSARRWRPRSPACRRERDAKEGAVGPSAITWRAESARRKAERAGAQAAERRRGRQGDFIPREGLTPSTRDGAGGAEGRREEKLRGCRLGDVSTSSSQNAVHGIRSRSCSGGAINSSSPGSLGTYAVPHRLPSEASQSLTD